MKPRRIYIAGPISKGDLALNTRDALVAADAVMARGHIPFIPHLTLVWHMMTPRDYEAWMAWDEAWLRQCEAVLRIPGESAGADREVALAESLGLHVFRGVEEFVEWHEDLAKGPLRVLADVKDLG